MTKQGLAQTGLQGQRVYALDRLSGRLGSMSMQQMDTLTIGDNALVQLESNAIIDLDGSSTINLVTTSSLVARITADDGTNEGVKMLFASQNGSGRLTLKAEGEGASRAAQLRLVGATADSGNVAYLEGLNSSGAVVGQIEVNGGATDIVVVRVAASTPALTFQSTNRAAYFYGRLYPGTGSANQTGAFMYAPASGDVAVQLASTNGTNFFYVYDSTGTRIFQIDSAGYPWFDNANTNATSTHYGMLPVNTAAGLKYIELWN